MCRSASLLILMILWRASDAVSDVEQIFVRNGEDCRLKCEGLPDKVQVLDWTQEALPRRINVFFYRDGRQLDDGQDSRFSNRVELTDPELSRDLSVTLKNVTSEDSGTYRCKAVYETSGGRKEISHYINLTVTEPNILLTVTEPNILLTVTEADPHPDPDPERGNTDRLYRGVITGAVVVLVLLVLTVVLEVVYFIKVRKTKNEKSPTASEEGLLGSCRSGGKLSCNPADAGPKPR